MKPIRDRLDDLHIYNDHSDDSGMSDEEVSPESEGSEEDDWEEQEAIVHAKLSSDELKGSPFACTTSSTAPTELVSAIKGSREEKQGSSPRELRVTWAPDVYEPAPMRLQDTVIRGTKQRKLPKKERTTGKEGHKGKEISRGGSSKDSTRGGGGGKDKKKKQNHRATGRSRNSLGYQNYEDGDDY